MKIMVRSSTYFLIGLSLLGCLVFPGCDSNGAATEETGVLPTVKVNCSSYQEIYKNNGDNTIDVTVQGTDHCQDKNSHLYLVAANRSVVGSYLITDGMTKSTTFSVKPGHVIDFACYGTSGECSYTVSVP